MTKEIGKWKEKHKMLTQYKQEADLNFKDKFQHMIQMEEERFKIKETINLIKYNPSTIIFDTPSKSPDLSTLVRSHLSRSES
jgi:Holliday junction resolvase RusA-like endonuclease